MAAEPARPEPVLRNGRGHNSERPAYRKKKKKSEKVKKDAIVQSENTVRTVYRQIFTRISGVVVSSMETGSMNSSL